MHVTRPEHGKPQGRIIVAEKRWRFNDTVLACPADWRIHAAKEQRFVDAERDRLLYVAATRAREELLVARYDDEAESPWSPFHPYLELGFPRLDLVVQPEPERVRLERSAASILAESEEVDLARAALAAPTFRADAVTRRVKSDAAETAGTQDGNVERETSTESATGDGGQRWGKLVHAALEIAGRGAGEAAQRAFIRTLLTDPELVPEDLEPDDHAADLLVAEVQKVSRSELWQRAERAQRRLVEVPFAIALDAGEYARLPGVSVQPAASMTAVTRPPAATSPAAAPAPAPPLEIVEGVIDLAFSDDDGWTIVDYKSDREGMGLDAARRARYRAQVDLYAACWTRITGEPVRERVLFFVADGTTDRW
jgi:ATP-dependent helicase/nuclease subunit A